MPFEDFEVSIQGGNSFELYALTLGSTTWRMTNSIDTFNFSGDDYFANTGIKRDRIVSDKETLTVPLPAGHPFPIQYTAIAPGQTATLTIWQVQRADPTDVKVLYKGVVRAVSYTDGMHGAEISLIPITQAFKKSIPDRTYQAGCNHILYDARCQVNSPDFKYSQTVSDVTLNTVTLPDLETSKGDGWATAGFVQFGGLDFRLVLEQNGDVLSLVLPFYQTVLGQVLDVFAGCDHTIGTCQSKFANEINFGGTPYVPTKNIFITGL